jgi:hypothetical protein
MTGSFPPDRAGDDLAWVRARLGPANPVPAGVTSNVPRPDLAAALVTADSDPWTPGNRPARGRRRVTVVTAVVGVAALLAAAAAVTVGGGSKGHGVVSTRSGTEILAAAAGTTEAAKTADVSVALELGSTPVTVQGMADLTTGSADFTADLSGMIGQVEIRSVAGAVYVKVPSALVAMAGGKPWVEADPSTLGALAGGPLGAIPGATSPGNPFDVTAVLNWLRGVSGPITTVSTTETVHGDPTTHYRTTVDLAKAAAAAPAGARAKLEPAAQAAGQGLPVDLWVDASGRLRRFEASFDTSKVISLPGEAPAPALGTVQVTVELWGFGTPVDVSAPPADQVGTLSGGLGRGLGGGLRGLLPAAKGLLPQG